MTRTQPVRSVFQDDSALPRGIVRLLRSGALTEEQARRVLEVHGNAVETYLRAARPVASS